MASPFASWMPEKCTSSKGGSLQAGEKMILSWITTVSINLVIRIPQLICIDFRKITFYAIHYGLNMNVIYLYCRQTLQPSDQFRRSAVCCDTVAACQAGAGSRSGQEVRVCPQHVSENGWRGASPVQQHCLLGWKVFCRQVRCAYFALDIQDCT